MKTLDTLSKDERSLLLYMETCLVEKAGRVDVRHMNQADCDIAERWTDEGFVRFGRIVFADIRGETEPANP